MSIRVRLLPPLNTAAGRSRVEIAAEGLETVGDLIKNLTDQFGEDFRRSLFSEDGRLIPAWCVFVNDRPPVYFNSGEALQTPLQEGDEVTFLLALAGG
jgi:MoaD family protein